MWACPLAYLFDVMAAERSIANNECASHGLTLTARHDAHVRAVVGGGGARCGLPIPPSQRQCESRRREGRGIEGGKKKAAAAEGIRTQREGVVEKRTAGALQESNGMLIVSLSLR